MPCLSRQGLSWLLRIVVAVASFMVHCNAVQFDYFLFTREWPATLCTNLHCRARPANVSIWTIHGLWPQYNNNSWPQFCDPGNKFDRDQVKDLLDKMNVEWPNLLYTNLWVHEWERHGTCALSVFSSQHAYFAASLQINEKYDLEEALYADGIVPSSTTQYKLADIHKSLDSRLGSAPQIQCEKGELNEVRMCVTKQLQPFDCPVKTIGCPPLVKLLPFPGPADRPVDSSTEQLNKAQQNGHGTTTAAAMAVVPAVSDMPSKLHVPGRQGEHAHIQGHMPNSRMHGSSKGSNHQRSTSSDAIIEDTNRPSTVVVVENLPGNSEPSHTADFVTASARMMQWVRQASAGKRAMLLSPTVIAAVFLAIILLAGSALALVAKPSRSCEQQDAEAAYMRLRSRSSSYCDMEAAPVGMAGVH